MLGILSAEITLKGRTPIDLTAIVAGRSLVPLRKAHIARRRPSPFLMSNAMAASLLKLPGFTTYGNSNEILSRASNGTRAAPTASGNGRVLLQLGATGHDGTNFVSTPRATMVESSNIVAQGLLREQKRLRSLSRFIDLDGQLHFGSQAVDQMSASLADAVKALLQMVPPSWADQRAAPTASDNRVPVRSALLKGPLAPNGDWVMEKAGASTATIAIARVPNSDDVTYEIVNFIDGRRTVSEIRNAVSA